MLNYVLTESPIIEDAVVLCETSTDYFKSQEKLFQMIFMYLQFMSYLIYFCQFMKSFYSKVLNAVKQARSLSMIYVRYLMSYRVELQNSIKYFFESTKCSVFKNFKFGRKLGYIEFSYYFSQQLKYSGFGNGSLNFSRKIFNGFYFKSLLFSTKFKNISLFNFKLHLMIF